MGGAIFCEVKKVGGALGCPEKGKVAHPATKNHAAQLWKMMKSAAALDRFSFAVV